MSWYWMEDLWCQKLCQMMDSLRQRSILLAKHSGLFFFLDFFPFLFLGYLVLNWIIYFALKATSHGVLETPCRDYNAECERQKSVEEFYRLQHINQTYDFVSNVSRIK